MKNLSAIICLSLFLLGLMTGCGVYSLSASGKPAFASVHIAQFENQTIEFDMGTLLTDDVINQFIADNSIEVLERSRSEALMIGTVVSYLREAFEYDINDIVSKYIVKVSIHVKVVRSNTDDVIWEEDFYAEGTYQAEAEVEEDGQRRAVEILSSNILDKTTKSW